MSNLIKLIVNRVLKENWKGLILSPIMYAFLFSLIVLISAASPELLTGITRSSLEKSREQLFDASKNIELWQVFVMVQGMFFLAVITSINAFNISTYTIKEELRNNTIEVYLASRLSVKKVGLSIALANSLLSITQYVFLTIFSMLPCLIYLILWSDTEFAPLTFVITFSFPCLIGLFVSINVSYICLYYPSILTSELSLGYRVLRAFALAPSIIVLTIITAIPQIQPIILAVSISSLTILIMIVLTWNMDLALNRSVILNSN